MPTCGSSCLRHYSREVMTMAKPLGKGSVTRRDRDRTGKLKPRNKCRVWELSVKLDDGTRPTRTFHGSYSAALDALDAFAIEVSDAGSGGTVRELMADWHARRKPQQANHTEVNEAVRVKALSRLIGDMDARDVTPRDVERVYARLMSGESLSGKPLSALTVAGYAMNLHSFFADMVEDGVVESNPVEQAHAPRVERGERRFWTPERVDGLMRELDFEEPHQRAVTLVCACGFRIGEVVALRGMDWDGSSLSVRYADDGKGNLKRPKSKAGIRSVPVPEPVGAKIDALGVADGEYLVTGSWGRDMMPADSLGTWWLHNRRRFGCELTLHELRHSYATRLAMAGVNPKVAQKLLGHSGLATTLQIYTHVSDEMAIDAVSRAFS